MSRWPVGNFEDFLRATFRENYFSPCGLCGNSSARSAGNAFHAKPPRRAKIQDLNCKDAKTNLQLLLDADDQLLSWLEFACAQFIQALDLFDRQSFELLRYIPERVAWLNDIGFGALNRNCL